MRSILIVLLTAAVAVGDPRPVAEGTPEHRKATELVAQLGHPRYATREAAAKQLLELGPAALPALVTGAGAADEEVRNRSNALVSQVKAREWSRRADTYEADREGKQKHDLPLLAEFEKRVGKPDAGSRNLYAQMVRRNGELLDLAAGDPPTASAARTANAMIKSRCETLTQPGTDRKQLKAHPGELAVLFFVHDRIGRERADWQGSGHPAHLLANPGLIEGLGDKDLGPSLRRVLVHWARTRPPDDLISHQYFALCLRQRPFPEAVPVLARLARDPKASVINVRALAIEALGKIGNDEAKADLQSMIDDSTSLLGRPMGEDFRLGDHAFATLLTSAGKKPADYGISTGITISFRFGAPGGEVVMLTLHAFSSDAVRQEGRKKWKAETKKD